MIEGVFVFFFCFGHCVVCPFSSYEFWLPLWSIQSPLLAKLQKSIFLHWLWNIRIWFVFNCMYIIYYIILVKRQLLLFKQSKYSQDKKLFAYLYYVSTHSAIIACFTTKVCFIFFLYYLDSINKNHTPNGCFLFDIILKDKKNSFIFWVWSTSCHGIRLGIWRFKVNFCWHRYGRGYRNCSLVIASSFHCFSFRKYLHATNLENETIVDIWIQEYNPKNTISLHYNLFVSESTWPTILIRINRVFGLWG